MEIVTYVLVIKLRHDNWCAVVLTEMKSCPCSKGRGHHQQNSENLVHVEQHLTVRELNFLHRISGL